MIFRSNALPLGLAGLLVGALTARVTLAAPASAQQPASLTGCLNKGTAKDTFNLKTKDGKTYPLTSSTVQLGQHVGHTVTVTGTPAMASSMSGHGKDTMAMSMPAGAVSVTKLSMVSESCK
jgi:hypothetical protein